MRALADKPENTDRLLTTKKVAELAGVSLHTVRRLLDRGELTGVRVGRLVRVRLSDWQAYLNRQRIGRADSLRVVEGSRAAVLRR